MSVQIVISRCPAIVLSLLLLVPASSAQESPSAIQYREIGGESLDAYVFSPETRSEDAHTSTVLLFHGGGWSVGTPEWTFNAARRFAEHGMVAIPIEYRLSRGDVTPVDALDDVCAAFRWVYENAGELGVDRSRIAGYGVSAGGHLVASTVTVGCGSDEISKRSAPDALLLWSPALDMARDGWFERKLQGRSTASALSPVEHVNAETPPTSIVQGDRDTLTPLAGARAFCRELTSHGTPCELNVYEGVGHLLTRNLEQQERDFDPDPDAVASGIERHLDFLREHGFITE